MAIYCKVVGGVIAKRERKTNPISKVVNGEPVWRELIPAGERPAYDSATHHAPVQTETIDPTQVVKAWVAAVAKTQTELNVENQAQQDNAIARTDRPNSIENVLLKICFLQENRIRVLEGKTEITAAQFKTLVRGQF